MITRKSAGTAPDEVQRPRSPVLLGDPQLQSAVNQAADQLVDMVEKFRKEKGAPPALLEIVQAMISAAMAKEREIFLERVEDSANGYYSRMLQSAIGRLHLLVPRVRNNASDFRPYLLPPPYKRVGREYEEVLAALLVNGYSQAEMQRALHKLDLPYSREAVEQIILAIQERLKDFQQMPLTADMLAVFIDAYHAKLRGEDKQVKEISIYTAVGIDLDGVKSILGYWVNPTGENLGFWVEVMQDLIRRGLKRPLLFLTDDFSGLKGVIAKLFPYSDHQLCFIHMQRNLRRHLSKALYSQVKKELYQARQATSKAEGVQHFQTVCDLVAKENPELAERLRERAPNYLAFLDYPVEARKHLYTTNIVESVNAGLELMRHGLGGYFPSREALDANYFVQIENRNERWLRRPLPTIAEMGYELRQMFELRFLKCQFPKF
jgi:transposase-like protein